MIRHRWDITPKEAVALQEELAGEVRIEPVPERISTIAGVDCAFPRKDSIAAAAVLCDAATLRVISSVHVVQPCRFPYIPGLLSFREAPAVIAALEQLPDKPDLIMCDGQGLAHPRRLGLACHIGLWLDLPTMGLAKSRLCGEHRPVALQRGSWQQLRHRGQVIGAVLRTRSFVKPLFVSVGHRATIQDVIKWTLRCATRYRMAEPVRQAHLLVTRLSKQERANLF